MTACARWPRRPWRPAAALLCAAAALLFALEPVACSRDHYSSSSSNISDVDPLPPLPTDVAALRLLLLRMRETPPHASDSLPSQPTSFHYLAASRANSFGHPRPAGAPGLLSLLVHFTAPVHSATLAALAECADGEVTASLGSGRFIVSGAADAVHRIRRFPGVSSVRVRSPADKLRVTAAAGSGDVHIHSRCMPPSQPCAARVAAALEARGCSVSSSQAPHYKAMGICPGRSAAAAAAAVAQLHDVDWVEQAPPFAALDFSGSRILWSQGDGSSLDAPFSAPLNGSGQLIAIADTGLDMSNCFFHYGQTVSAANTNTRIDAGNVHTYWSMGSCEQCGHCPRACSDFIDFEGHGTHVAGIAAGRANRALAGSGAAAAENGLAVGASLFFQDISASTGFITPPIHLQQLFAPAYEAGARVHSNSWGCSGSKPSDCNAYSLSAQEVDAFAFDRPDFVVVFAAGNAGPADDSIVGTVSSPATCKNCLSVGSSNIGFEGAARNWQYTSPLDICERRRGEDKPLPPCCAQAADSAAGSACSLQMLSCCPWDDELLCCSDEAQAAGSIRKPKLNAHVMSDFSSVGPTRDGRLKPDVVAPGLMIASANAHNAFSSSAPVANCSSPPSASATNVDWSARAVQLMSGTSMAAPAIAAFAAVVRQWFQEGWYPSGSPDSNSSLNPSSALVRAVIAASAAPLTAAAAGARPSLKSGFGLPSLTRALYIASSGGSGRLAVVDTSSVPPAGSASIAHGAHNVVTAQCSGGQVAVALAWNDPPGHPSAALQLVNDLDLLVWSSGARGAEPALLYGNGDAIADSRNNLETVTAPCAAGSNITAAVYGAVVLSPRQSYALVISGAILQSTFAAANVSERVIQAAANGRSIQGLGPRAYPSNSPCAAGADSSRPILANFLFKGSERPPAGTCSDQDISLALATLLRISLLSCSVYGRGDNFVQVRFACDVSIGLDLNLAETRAVQTLNFLLALAQKAQSQADASAAGRALRNGCLRFFDWSSVAVVTASASQPPQRSGACALAAPSLFSLSMSLLLAIAAFCQFEV